MRFFNFLKPKCIKVEQNMDSAQTTFISNSGIFEFFIEDVFSTTGRGTEVTVIEMFRKNVDYA